MRTVKLKQNGMYSTFFIHQYDNLKFDALIEKIESIILENDKKPLITSKGENHLILLFEEMLPEIFPNFSDDDIELAIEKLYEEIGVDITYFVPRKMEHLLNNDLEREKQILLYCYRLRESLHVNWKHLQEIADQRYQDAVKGGLFDCDDITFESEEALSQKGEL